MQRTLHKDKSGIAHSSIDRFSRSGAATVELALMIPLVVLLIFGSIEASNAIYLKQAAAVAAYEAARVASSPGGTEAAARHHAVQVLSSRDINSAIISVTPAITATTPRGTEVTVTVTVPANANSIGPGLYYRDANLTSRSVMSRL